MRFLRKISVAVAASLLVLLLVELVIQAVGDPRRKELAAQAKEQPAYWDLARAGVLVGDPEDELRFRLRPGFHTTVDGIEYRVNELGLRGGTVAPKTGGDGTRRRVLVLGDSYAFGLGVNEEDSLPKQLEKLLRERGMEVEVVNAGVPAYQTGQELAWLERSGFALGPDLVVRLYYPNDNVEAALAYAPSLNSLYVDELPLPHSWKPALSRSYLYSVVAKLDANRRLKNGDFEARGERNWPVTVERLRALAAVCRERSVAFLFAPLPELSISKQLRDDDSEVAQDHARVLALARAEQWPVVDLRDGLLARVNMIEKFFLAISPLDNHLNAAGYRVVAELLEPEAVRLLQPR